MKTLAMTIILSGLLSTGVAFAADSQQSYPCQTECASHCSQIQHAQQDSGAVNLSSHEYDTSGG